MSNFLIDWLKRERKENLGMDVENSLAAVWDLS